MQKARELKNSIRMDKRYYTHCKAEETEEASSRNDQHKLFRITKKLGGTSSRTYNGLSKTQMTTSSQKTKIRKLVG